MKAIPFMNAFRRYGLSGLASLFVSKALQQARLSNYEYAKEKVTKRMAQGRDRGDFFDHVLKHSDDEKGMSCEELVSTGSTLVLAGSETTATLLSGATYFLLRNPSTMTKLIAEIRNSFSDESKITLHSVEHLRYMGAVLEESLRMYPPVPSTSRYRTVPAGGDNVLGRWLPGGVSFSTIPNPQCSHI
jgi:cytochrome P450